MSPQQIEVTSKNILYSIANSAGTIKLWLGSSQARTLEADPHHTQRSCPLILLTPPQQDFQRHVQGCMNEGIVSSPPHEVLITRHLCQQTPVPGSVTGADQRDGQSSASAGRESSNSSEWAEEEDQVCLLRERHDIVYVWILRSFCFAPPWLPPVIIRAPSEKLASLGCA